MKIYLLIFLLFLTYSLSASNNQDDFDKNNPDVIKNINNVRIPWIQNNGQQPNEVAYYAKTFAGTVFVNHSGELIYNLPIDSTRSYSFVERFFSENELKVTPGTPSETKVNYFIGNDSEKWKTDISTFQSVNLGEPWQGIKVECNAYGNNIEKLFYVEPGADPSNIRITIKGSKKLKISDSGELIISTSEGETKFTKPVAWQIINDEKVFCKSEYWINNKTYGFKLTSYNPNLQIIIDPLLSSTFIGGDSDGENALNIKIDNFNNVIICGYTHSSDYPVTPGVFSTVFTIGNRHIVISKLSCDLSNLIASTFIGGNSEEMALSLNIDNDNNIYITGYTQSGDYPVTPNAYCLSYKAGPDAIVSKLNSDLNILLASTFIGGWNSEISYSSTLDFEGNIIFIGFTNSAGYPVLSNSFDNSYNGQSDIFISKLDSNLENLLASTFIGGINNESGNSIMIDNNSNITISGASSSPNYPVTPNAYDQTHNSDGFGDIIVSTLSSDLSSLLFSTFLGGSDSEYTASMCSDNVGNIYIAGITSSSDFPVTPGAFDVLISAVDITVSKLSFNLSELQASTFLGGSNDDFARSIIVDEFGDVYITGDTESQDYPVTSYSYDTTFNTICDIIITKLESDLSDVIASTFVGGSSYERSNSILLDSLNNIYITGWSDSFDYPITPDAYDQNINEHSDIIISKFDNLFSLNSPLILIQPNHQNICEKAITNFFINSPNSEAFQWQVNQGNGFTDLLNNEIYSGVTDDTLSIIEATSEMNGYLFRCAAINIMDTVYSEYALLTVYDSTQIVTQPINSNVCEGETSVFTISAIGNDLTYQWYKNGNLISGAINPTLILNPVSLSDEGNYHCIVNGTCGNDISESAFLNVLHLTEILLQPQDTTNCIGSQVGFFISSAGENLYYQWRKGGININGAILPTLIISNITPSDTGMYDCVVSGDCGILFSNPALLSIGNTQILIQPLDIITCENENISFSVSATGMNLSFQWRKDAVNIPGAISSTLIFNPAALGDAGIYDCVVTGDCDSQISNPATLTVHPLTEITLQPQSDNICEGDNITFNIGALGFNLSYQWLKNGNPISGATNPYYQISGATIEDIGLYSCQVSGYCGMVISNSANLIVYETTEIIQNPPTEIIACESENMTLFVQAIGNELTYQWSKDSEIITGATDPSFSITDLSQLDQGSYQCEISGTCDTVFTIPSNLIVYQLTELITQPLNISTCEGNEALFWVHAVGQDLTYQWRKDGTDIPGATETQLTISNAFLIDAGLYDCKVFGYCNDTISVSATLEVWQSTEIITHPANSTICEGEHAELNVSTMGHGLTYQWYKNSVLLSGETEPVLSFNNVTLNDIGNYYCIVTGDCGTVTSNSASLNVTELVGFLQQPDPATVQSGEMAIFSVLGSGPINEYRWRKDEEYLTDGVNISGSSSVELIVTNVDVEDTGEYDCEISGECNTEISEPATLTILGINTNLIGNIKIYPNPTTGNLIITSLNNDIIFNIEIYNQLGSMLLSIPINDTNDLISLSGFEKGMYLIKIVTQNNIIFTKIILK